MLNLMLYLGGHATGPTAAGTFISNSTQIRLRGLTIWHDLLWVLILQLIEREVTSVSNLQRLCHQLIRESLCQAKAGAQVAFGVLLQVQAAFRQWLANPDGSHHVLQGLTRADMHVHVASRHQWNGSCFAGLSELVQPNLIVQSAQLFDAEPTPADEMLQCPLPDGQKLLRGTAAVRRHDHKAIGQFRTLQVIEQKSVSSLFLRRSPQARNELTQVAVAVQVAGQYDQIEGLVTLNLKLRANE